MEAGLAVLAAENGFIGKAAEGLGDRANRGEDGISVFAAMGGGQSRYETGSHVKANTWGGIVAVGARNELESGTLEWGGFVEHGSGNFTLYSGAGYGSGSSTYTGGGLLAKWQNKQDVYTEASLRMERMHDSASDILRDARQTAQGSAPPASKAAASWQRWASAWSPPKLPRGRWTSASRDMQESIRASAAR